MKNIFRALNQIYYLFYTLIILLSIIGYFLTMNNFLDIDISKSTEVFFITLQSIISAATLLFYMYFLFKYTAIKRISDLDIRKIQYFKFAKLRLFFVGFNVVIGVLVYYFLRTELILYLIAPSAILLLLSKPNEIRINDYLTD